MKRSLYNKLMLYRDILKYVWIMLLLALVVSTQLANKYNMKIVVNILYCLVFVFGPQLIVLRFIWIKYEEKESSNDEMRQM